MEFEDEEPGEEEEEEEEEEEISIPPPSFPPSYDSIGRPRVNSAGGDTAGRRSGAVRYRECLKNHAVGIGGHAVDGCGEFMAAGEEGTLDALKCAACNCHRNFHRKETDNNGDPPPSMVPPPPPPPPSSSGVGALYPQFSPYYRTPAPPPSGGYIHVSRIGTAPHHHHHHHNHHPQRPVAVVPSTSGGTHSGEMDDVSHPSSSGGGGGGMVAAKKRFRTKFTPEQKDKMLEFAEKLGWRIQKHDEASVQQFCSENQINRKVLKVWMHNNKLTLGKKP